MVPVEVLHNVAVEGRDPALWRTYVELGSGDRAVVAAVWAGCVVSPPMGIGSQAPPCSRESHPRAHGGVPNAAQAAWSPTPSTCGRPWCFPPGLHGPNGHNRERSPGACGRPRADLRAMGEDGFTLGRRPALDGLRGIAVLLVIIGHQTRSVTGAAWAGVTIFFVLSGFLITRLLLEEHRETGRIDRTAFYTRRARRLLPALALLLLYFAMAALTGKYPWQPIAFAVTFTANLAATFGVILGGLGHTWSLALEEQFYALWPFALIPLARHRHGSKILIMAALGPRRCASPSSTTTPPASSTASAQTPEPTPSSSAACWP